MRKATEASPARRLGQTLRSRQNRRDGIGAVDRVRDRVEGAKLTRDDTRRHISRAMGRSQCLTRGGGSLTVTVNLFADLLPAESAAVQATIVVPSPKSLPEGGLHLGFSAPSRLSVAETS